LRSRFRRGAYREMVKRANRMVAVSEAVREAMCRELDLSAVQADRLAVVTNGVPVPEVLGAEVRAEARRVFNLPNNARVFVAVGRLSPQKNLGELVTGLSMLGDEAGDWQCLIAGEGPERADLEKRIRASGLETQIRLLGNLDRVDQLLAAADCYCLTSSWEGLPLALLEGMAAGLPVAAAAIDGVGEVVTHGREGLLHKPGNADGLAVNLLQLLSDNDLRRRMGETARARVSENFNFENTVDALENLYGAGHLQQESSR